MNRRYLFNMNLSEYFAAVRKRLDESENVAIANIVDERFFRGKGYFRARLTLRNGDFLEIAESFIEKSN